MLWSSLSSSLVSELLAIITITYLTNIIRCRMFTDQQTRDVHSIFLAIPLFASQLVKFNDNADGLLKRKYISMLFCS